MKYADLYPDKKVTGGASKDDKAEATAVAQPAPPPPPPYDGKPPKGGP